MIASVYVPFFFIEDYGLRLGLGTDISFYLLSIMNAASFFGRLAPNWLADKSVLSESSTGMELLTST